MQYEIETGGRLRQVTVTRAGDGFAVSVDGRLHQVDAVRIDAHTLSLLIDRVWLYDTVIVPESGRGRFVVQVGSAPVTAVLSGRRRGWEGAAGGAPGSGPQRITAPMPGKVVRVLVAAGDAVHARQPVLVVEAMKMENELRAGRDGMVAEVHVEEGMSVDAGALLMLIQ